MEVRVSQEQSHPVFQQNAVREEEGIAILYRNPQFPSLPRAPPRRRACACQSSISPLISSLIFMDNFDFSS